MLGIENIGLRQGRKRRSVVSLMAYALQEKGYGVLALDGDASNPGGLARLLLGSMSMELVVDWYSAGFTIYLLPKVDPNKNYVVKSAKMEGV